MHSYRFKRSSKLRKPADYQYVFEQAERSGDRYFTVLARCNEQQNQARLGLVVSKKNVRQACTRNRIKRLIRESFRLHQSLLDNVDYVVLARRGTGAVDNARLMQSLGRHWHTLQKSCVTA